MARIMRSHVDLQMKLDQSKNEASRRNDAITALLGPIVLRARKFLSVEEHVFFSARDNHGKLTHSLPEPASGKLHAVLTVKFFADTDNEIFIEVPIKFEADRQYVEVKVAEKPGIFFGFGSPDDGRINAIASDINDFIGDKVDNWTW